MIDFIILRRRINMGSRKRRKELKYKTIPLEDVYRTLSSLEAPEQELLKKIVKVPDYPDRLKQQNLQTQEDYSSLFSKLREISLKYQIAIITHQWKGNGNQISQLKNSERCITMENGGEVIKQNRIGQNIVGQSHIC